jgi:hypothetical protein
MATLNPTLDFNVSSGGTPQVAPSGLQALSGLIGTGLAVGVSGLSGGTATEPSAAQRDERLYTEFARQLGRVNDLRLSGDESGASALEGRVATEFVVRGGDLTDGRATSLVTQMTGRPEGFTLGMSEDQFMLQQLMADPEFQTDRLVTYALNPEATEEERNQLALDSMARREANNAVISNATFAWNQGGESAFNYAISDFQNVLMGGIAAAEQRDGVLSLQDVQEARMQYNEFRTTVTRPTGVSADEWTPVQAQLDLMGSNLDYLEEIAGPNNLSARMVGDLMAAMDNSDATPLEKTVLGLAVKDNPSLFIEMGVIGSDRIQEVMRSVNFPTNSISESGLSNSDRWPTIDYSEMSPQQIRDENNNQMTVANAMSLDTPEQRSTWARTSITALSGWREMGSRGTWMTSSDYDNFFSEAFFNKLEDLKTSQPELHAAVSTRAISVLQSHGQSVNSRLQSLQRESGVLFNPSTGRFMVNEERFTENLTASARNPEDVGIVLSAIDELYGGNYEALFGDRGQKLIDEGILGEDRDQIEFLMTDMFKMVDQNTQELGRSANRIAEMSATLSAGITPAAILGAQTQNALSNTAPTAGVPPVQTQTLPANTTQALEASGARGLIDLVDQREGAGNYDTLFGHVQANNSGPFSGVRVSQMTIGEIREFAGDRGAGSYGQYVKEANPLGVLATPMGRYQFVGTTMLQVASDMGLPDNTVFTPEVQDAMFLFKVNERLEGANTPEARRREMRAEWDGFRYVSDPVLDQAIEGYLSGDPVDLSGIISRPQGQRAPTTSIAPDIRPFIAPEIREGGIESTRSAPTTSISPQTRGQEDNSPFNRGPSPSRGSENDTTASQSATRELDAAVMSRLEGAGIVNVRDEETLQAVIESGGVQEGDTVIMNNRLVIAEMR